MDKPTANHINSKTGEKKDKSTKWCSFSSKRMAQIAFYIATANIRFYLMNK